MEQHLNQLRHESVVEPQEIFLTEPQEQFQKILVGISTRIPERIKKNAWKSPWKTFQEISVRVWAIVLYRRTFEDLCFQISEKGLEF